MSKSNASPCCRVAGDFGNRQKSADHRPAPCHGGRSRHRCGLFGRERPWLCHRARRSRSSANEVTMKTTSESLSPSETSNGRAAGGNCVVVRRGGEQPEADPQTQTKVKPIRPVTRASLLDNGEACGESHERPTRHSSLEGRGRIVGGGWAEYAGKFSWWTVESCAGRNPRERGSTAVRAAIVARKRSNVRGAKGGRKVERPRP
jgi:hypothetical protein